MINYSNRQIVHIRSETLTHVLGKMLSTNIIRASYRTKQLHGGTLGDVRLVTGMAESSNGKKLPYKIVLKIQKEWERPGDPDSWRREYDLYTSGFSKVFTDSLRWPECYHAEMNRGEIHLWIEYIDGISGDRLDIETLEFAATELGRFQGKIYGQQEIFRNMDFLSSPDALRRNYEQWHTQTFSYEFLISDQCRIPGFLKQMLKNGEIQLFNGKSFEYGCLRTEGCNIPEHLKQMLFDIDDNKEALFDSFKRLPVVLCHRDFWTENIFLSDGKIRMIDWDCAGFGYLGEDIASLIYDETETENLHEYFRRLVPAYIKGISEYLEVPPDFSKYVLKMILIIFGYRTVQNHVFTESPEFKEEQVKRLQKIYEMRNM
jgi:thiamine kinase-like enzyme